MSIAYTCGLFGVSRQVYYRSISSRKSKQEKAVLVLELVDRVRMEMPRLGTRKLFHILHKELKALSVGRDRLFSILKANKMLIKPLRSYHVTTNSYHRFRKYKNLIEGLAITRPEQVWVSDITYIGKRDNPMYLALVTDAYSKKIMGYNVSNTLAAAGSVSALKQAERNRCYTTDKLTHHSDRGFQYCCDEYQKQLKKGDIICSMTESYDPYANAVAERINGVLKQEFLMDTEKYDLKVVKKIVEQTVKIYNEKRPHTSTYFMTPEKAHQQNELKIKTYKSKRLSENVFTES